MVVTKASHIAQRPARDEGFTIPASAMSTTVSAEAGRERRVAVQQPVVERPVDQIDRDLDVEVRGRLAALDGARERCAHRLAARLDETRAVGLGELRVRLGLGDEGGDDAPERLSPDLSHPRPDEGEQVPAQRSGVARRRAGARPVSSASSASISFDGHQR